MTWERVRRPLTRWLSLYLMAGFRPVCRESRAKEGGREENNLDSDYQPASTQEGGNVSMATETTSQCHVTAAAAAVSRQTTSGSGRRVAPARRAAGAQSRADLCGGTPGLRLGERLTGLRAARSDLISDSNTSSESDGDAGQEVRPTEAKCVRNGRREKVIVTESRLNWTVQYLLCM